MAKPIMQSIGLNYGIEPTPSCLEAGARIRLLAKIARVVRKLAVYLPGRRQRTIVESFIPRESHERERRLEFARFIHW